MAGLTEQQQAAVLSTASRILVSAGAGSGKTHVLVERYIERLRRDTELGVNGLIAVTFTRKAANEMRIRLKKRMYDLMQETVGVEQERWTRCWTEIDGARIGTIHSLCENIIKTFPLDAGVDPQLEILDDLAQARLLAESINQAFREIIDRQLPEHQLLLEFDMNQIRGWLTNVLRSSLQFQEAVQDLSILSDEDFVDYAKRIMHRARVRGLQSLAKNDVMRGALADLRSCSSSEMTASLNDVRMGAISYASELLALLEDSSDEERIHAAWLAAVELGQLKPGNTGGNKEGAKITRAAIKKMRELCADTAERVPAELVEVDYHAFKCARWFVAIAARAHDLYASAKRERYTADYNDLIGLALQALEKPGSSAKRFYNNAVAEILVDEFQDTNRIQSKLVSLLVGPDTALFLIGDDKQSIYKFQGADVSTFNEWKNDVDGSEQGALLSLSRSFRSHPQIVGFVNSLFSDLMGPDKAAGLFDASFNALDAARKNDPVDTSARVEVVCYSDGAMDPSGGRSEQNRRAEGKAVAQWIQNKISTRAPVEEKSGITRPMRYGDFAILVQRNKDFSAIEKELVACKIPYVMLGGRNFLDRQEIYDVENLLTFLSAPLNDHALIGALRSPMFAIGDDLIHAINNAKASGASFWQAMLSNARQRKPGFEPIRRAVALLKQIVFDSGRLQLPELLRKIIERTSYDIVLLGLPNGKQRSRNLWKLVALAANKPEQSYGEFAETLRLMREFNVQQTDAALDSEDAVKLMTIHGSKGLEFPAVILPVLDATGGPRNERVLFHREYGIAFNTARTDTDEKPAYFQVATGINEEMELAEKKRLFYVATTRARDYLGLFFNPDSRNAPSFRTWLRDWLGLDQADAECIVAADREQACSVTYVEILDEPPVILEDEKELAARSPMKWDLVWPSMDGEVAAPAPNSGVRITCGQSRQRLEPTVIGTLFHALMENLSSDLAPPSERFIECLAFAQGDVAADRVFQEALIAESRSLLQQFYESDLYLNLKSARRRFHEIPYVISGERETSKRPDLLYEDHQGRWHVVDYKTDRVAESDVDAHLKEHEKQVSEYVNELHRLTGISFSGSVYFAQLGLLRALPGLSLAAV